MSDGDGGRADRDAGRGGGDGADDPGTGRGGTGRGGGDGADDSGTGRGGTGRAGGDGAGRGSAGRSLLSVEGLRAGYGETDVLGGVSFEVAEGEVAALVGRNGVGKTTTLRAVTGAIPVRAGRVRFRGEDVTGLSPVDAARLGMGLVPERRRVFPGLTVRENLRMAQLGGSDAATRWSIGEVFDAFGNLEARAGNRGADLSGGEQQMLAVARALVAGADLLLLDEPTEGLAPMVVERLERAIREVNDGGVTVLLVEQNVAVALGLADRAFVLDDGRIVHAAPADELREDTETLDRYLGVSV